MNLSRLTRGLVFALCAAPVAAAAQDSYARVTDQTTGEPVLSVIGTGLGRRYASLVLDIACPTPTAWVMEVSGAHFPPNVPVRVGFGDPRGGWHEIQLRDVGQVPQGRLRIAMDRSSFRAALAEVRSGEPNAPGADVMVAIGDALGLSVRLDPLVREMTAFAQACEPPSPRRPATRPVAATRSR